MSTSPFIELTMRPYNAIPARKVMVNIHRIQMFGASYDCSEEDKRKPYSERTMFESGSNVTTSDHEDGSISVLESYVDICRIIHFALGGE